MPRTRRRDYTQTGERPRTRRRRQEEEDGDDSEEEPLWADAQWDTESEGVDEEEEERQKRWTRGPEYLSNPQENIPMVAATYAPGGREPTEQHWTELPVGFAYAENPEMPWKPPSHGWTKPKSVRPKGAPRRTDTPELFIGRNAYPDTKGFQKWWRARSTREDVPFNANTIRVYEKWLKLQDRADPGWRDDPNWRLSTRPDITSTVGRNYNAGSNRMKRGKTPDYTLDADTGVFARLRY